MKNGKIMKKILLFILTILFSQYAYGLSWTVTQHDNSNCGNNCRWSISNQGSTFTAKVEDDAKYGAGGIVAILNPMVAEAYFKNAGFITFAVA